MGGTSLITPSPIVLQRVNAFFMCKDTDKLVAFYRLQIGSEIFYSSKYERVKKRNSFTVTYLDNCQQLKFGFIDLFLYIHGQTFAVIKQLPTINTSQQLFQLPVECPKIVPVNVSVDDDSVDVIPVANLSQKSLFIHVSPHSFVADLTLS